MMFPDGAWCARRRIDLAAFMLAALGAKGPALHGTPGVRLNPFCAEECSKFTPLAEWRRRQRVGFMIHKAVDPRHAQLLLVCRARQEIAILRGPCARRVAPACACMPQAPDHVNAIAIGRYSMHPALALFQTWPWSRAPLLSGIAESSGKPGGASATASSSLRAA